MFTPTSSSSRPRPTMRCGTQRSGRWLSRARCTASCACTGQRKYWSGLQVPNRRWRMASSSTTGRSALQISSPRCRNSCGCRFSLDGRDPNGYVGLAWAILGIHDMGWAERAIFGKIRFMNYDGCRRKFDVPAFERKYGSSSAPPKSFFSPKGSK